MRDEIFTDKGFRSKIELICDERISDDEFSYHCWQTILYEQGQEEYVDTLYDYSNMLCISCEKSALFFHRGERGPHWKQHFFVDIDGCFILCRNCWLSLADREWLEIASMQHSNLKHKEYEASLSDVEKHEREERKKVNAKFRRDIHIMDNYQCVYCGKDLSKTKRLPIVEHMMPLSRFGETSTENCVTSCNKCNRKKRNNTPEEAGMELKHGRFEGDNDV